MTTSKYILMTLLLFLLCSCGGGSAGTGGSGPDDFQLRGTVISEEGEAIANATIILEETGDSTTSDAAGSYQLTTTFPGETANLRVESDEISETVQLTRLSARTVAEVELEIDRRRGGVMIISATITPREDSENGSNESFTSLFEGMLLGDMGPIDGATIRIAGQTTTTVAGSFSVEVQASGDVVVSIRLPNNTSFRTRLLNIPEESVLVEVEIQVPPRGGPSDRPERPRETNVGIKERPPRMPGRPRG